MNDRFANFTVNSSVFWTNNSKLERSSFIDIGHFGSRSLPGLKHFVFI